MSRRHHEEPSGKDNDAAFADLVDGLHHERRRRHEAGGCAPSDVLIADSEAFLTGRLAEALAERGEPVPVWAWVNVLAHGDVQGLRRAAATIDGRHGSRPWRHARSRLARRVLALACDEEELRTLQAEVLAPLELDLAAVPEVERLTPVSLLFIVEDALGLRR